MQLKDKPRVVHLGVSDEKLVRIESLRAVLDGRAVPARERAAYLAGKCGKSLSFWSGLLGGHRSFGEKVARSIEHFLELPRGHLDQALGENVDQPRAPVEAPMDPGELALLREFRRLKTDILKGRAIERLATMADAQDQGQFFDWLAASSKGQYFNEEVKGRHDCLPRHQ